MELRDGSKTIIAVLDESEDPLRSKKIRSDGNIAEGSLHHFLRPLRDHGLVEIVGYEETDGGANDAPLYGLTDHGQRLAESHDWEVEDPEPELDEGVVEELWSELEDQEETDRYLERRIKNIEEQLEDHEEIIEIVRGSLGDS